MSLGTLITLNNGTKVPQIGLGTWLSEPGKVRSAVTHALKDVGYRHIDAALVYGNQVEVGEGIVASGVPRSEIFLTSKLWNTHHRPDLVERDLDLSLKQLGTDYLDLFLVHWPIPFKPSDNFEELMPSHKGAGGSPDIDVGGPGVADVWLEMVKLLNTGKVRAIGVSNCTIEHLEKIIKASDVTPAMNQIEAHALLQQPELEAYCKEKGIHMTGYSPLGNNIVGRTKLVETPKVQQIAKKANKDPAQILIGWLSAKGFIVIPKSVTPSRIESNFQQYMPSKEESDEISNLVQSQGRIRYNIPYCYEPSWDINIFDEDVEKKASVKAW